MFETQSSQVCYVFGRRPINKWPDFEIPGYGPGATICCLFVCHKFRPQRFRIFMGRTSGLNEFLNMRGGCVRTHSPGI